MAQYPLRATGQGWFQGPALRLSRSHLNAGFELASEALTLGKKLLVKPLGGQFEQLTNGKTLELMGLAQLMDSLDANAVRNWLDAPSPGQIVYPDVATALALWLAEGAEETLANLSRRLWAKALFPRRWVIG